MIAADLGVDGLFATAKAPNGRNGLLYGGGFELLGVQALAAGAVLAYSFILTLLIAVLFKAVMGLRVSPATEVKGLDIAVHAESAYDLAPASPTGGGALPHPGVVARPTPSTSTIENAPVAD